MLLMILKLNLNATFFISLLINYFFMKVYLKYKVEEFTGIEIEKINIFVEGVRVID